MTDYRNKCLREKDEICEICGSDENILVHHLDGDRSNNAIENLVPVCDGCHRQIHNKNPEVAEYVRKLGFEPREREHTSIEVTDEVWERLNLRKTRPGMTFNDVLRNLLDESAER